MLPAVGCTTASANAVATAASTAVPPAVITSAPIFDAISFCDATMPFWARVGTDTAERGEAPAEMRQCGDRRDKPARTTHDDERGRGI